MMNKHTYFVPKISPNKFIYSCYLNKVINYYYIITNNIKNWLFNV